MADVLVRLDVQSEAYESKLKNATANLQHMEKEVRRVGATFEVADKEDLEFIKSLGSMETHATNASGKIKEMTQSIAEMTMVYNKMSDAEKNAATGQALAASIAQQKGNLAEFKNALADASGEAQKTGGFIDTLADGLGQLGPVGQMAGKLLKGAFGPVGIAIAAVVGIIQQLVEAFKRNEDAMAGASRAAAPFKAIWQQIQQLFDRLVPYIAKGMETIANGMQSLFSKITDWMGKLSQTSIGKKLGLDTVYEQLKKVSSAQAELTESNKKIADSENALNKMRRSTDTGNTQRRAQISELRFKASDKTNYSAEERVGFLEKAQELEGKTLQANIALRQKEYELIKLKNSLTQSGTEDLNAENAALNAITDARTEYNDHIRATQRQLESARKEMEKTTEVETKQKGKTYETQTGPSGYSEEGISALRSEIQSGQKSMQMGSDEYMFQADRLVDLTTFENLLKTATANGIQPDPALLESLFETIDNAEFSEDALKLKPSVSDEAWEELTAQINAKLADLGLDPIALDVKTGSIKAAEKEMSGLTENVQGAIGVFGQLGSAMQQIDDPGAKVAGLVMGAVAEVAATFAGSLKGTFTPWDWIAAAISGVSTMIATISAIKSATSGGFANGGKIPGNSFSGDNMRGILPNGDLIGLDAGEVILNRAQQGAIASQLQGAAQQTVMVEGRISGKDILLSANNTNRAAGGSRGYYTKVK